MVEFVSLPQALIVGGVAVIFLTLLYVVLDRMTPTAGIGVNETRVEEGGGVPVEVHEEPIEESEERPPGAPVPFDPPEDVEPLPPTDVVEWEDLEALDTAAAVRSFLKSLDLGTLLGALEPMEVWAWVCLDCGSHSQRHKAYDWQTAEELGEAHENRFTAHRTTPILQPHLRHVTTALDPDREHVCEECGEEFATQHQLNGHMRAHPAEDDTAEQCQEVTEATGEQCSFSAKEGSDYCGIHQKEDE